MSNGADPKPDRKLQVLDRQYGHAETIAKWSSQDEQGNPIPWYTYPAFEYLEQLDFSDARIFEFGCGNSTRFWSRVARTVTSVEENPDWYETIVPQLPENAQVLLREQGPSYEGAIAEQDGQFDVIVIDGSRRRQCARLSVDKLAPAGLIVLDNSDWYVKAADTLHAQGYLQVDMSGFGPINNYTWTTTLFFDRSFNRPPLGGRQPVHSRGAIRKYAEEEQHDD